VYAVPLLDSPRALQVALDCVRFCLNLTASFPDMGRSPLLLPLVIEMARMLPMYLSDEVGTGCKACSHCCKDVLWKFVLSLLDNGLGGGVEGLARFYMPTEATKFCSLFLFLYIGLIP
jgi:hypothetical protein